jgi:aspartate 1-decarboxylase
MRTLLRSLIRNATVTATDVAGLGLDAYVLRAAELLPFEEVQIVNVATGERFRTWVEEAPQGSGSVAVAARKGDVIEVLSFVTLHEGQTLGHKPRIVTLDAQNQVLSVVEGSDPS